MISVLPSADHGTSNISGDVPAEIDHDHEALVGFSEGTAQWWSAEAKFLAMMVADETGAMIEAPGFESHEQLEAFATRAKTAQLRTWLAHNGTAMVAMPSPASPVSVGVTKVTVGARIGHS